MRHLAVLLGLGFVLASCGGVESGRDHVGAASTTGAAALEEGVPDGEADGDGSRESSASWYTVGSEHGPLDPGSVPLAEALGVFSKPRMHSDEVPSHAREMLVLVDDVRMEASRLLVRDVGAGGVDLYGVPTRGGSVCAVVVGRSDETDAGASCAKGLRGGVHWSLSGDDMTTRVFGLTADDVVSLSLIVAGEKHEVALGRNGFYTEVAVADACPQTITRLDVVRADGARASRPLAIEWGPEPLGPTSCGGVEPKLAFDDEGAVSFLLVGSELTVEAVEATPTVDQLIGHELAFFCGRADEFGPFGASARAIGRLSGIGSPTTVTLSRDLNGEAAFCGVERVDGDAEAFGFFVPLEELLDQQADEGE